MKKIVVLICLLFFLKNINAQFQDVFPGMTGDELLENLIDTYKLSSPPDQAVNRDTLFGTVDNKNDSLTCVYSNYKIYLNPNADPTQAAFDMGINTEHTYPKSLGAEGDAEGDMHHLYAARADVNNDRGNLPFSEIPDNQTENWYYLDQKTSSIPSTNIDLYSERRNGQFEPPEAHKGNVARAMMYFYTMYKDNADAEDPNYFETQRETFCAWHFLDPVDQQELDRTWQIAAYQEGKPNPFILDCTLPERSYCQDFGMQCEPTAVAENEILAEFSFDKIIPNPIQDGATFYFNTKIAGDILLEIFDLVGNKLEASTFKNTTVGENSIYWENRNNIPAGIVICQLSLINKKGVKRMVKKAVVLK
ncbi:MAG: endonuclease [Bacteroidota bacterium]